MHKTHKYKKCIIILIYKIYNSINKTFTFTLEKNFHKIKKLPIMYSTWWSILNVISMSLVQINSSCDINPLKRKRILQKARAQELFLQINAVFIHKHDIKLQIFHPFNLSSQSHSNRLVPKAKS